MITSDVERCVSHTVKPFNFAALKLGEMETEMILAQSIFAI